MKKMIMFSFALLFFGLYTQAQEMDARKERKRIKLEQKQMKDLDLNDNQGQQLKDINSNYRDAHKQIMKNDALTQEQKQEQIRTLNKKRVADIHNIVGPDKVKDVERIQKNNKEEKQEKEKKNKKEEKEKEKKQKEKKNKKG